MSGESVLPRVDRDARAMREALEGRPSRPLSRGGWGNPDVRLVETAGGPVVVKDFAPRSALVRRILAPWLIGRELAAYARLADVGAVPRVLGRLGRGALVLEYRPGTLLSRSLRGELPSGFLDELEAAIAEMHARGVVHLDLRHRSNVLAGDDGRPVLLDFASAIRVDPASRVGRVVVRWLGAIDRRALAKWRVKLTPGPAGGR